MSKKKSTTTSNTTSTMTPNAPTWVSQGAQDLGSTIMNLGTKDPTSYVASANPMLTDAATKAQGLTTSPYYGQAADIFGKVGQAGANTYNPVMGQAASMSSASLLDGLDKYMSPFTQRVVDTTLADFDQNAGQQRAQAALDEARSGAFGGSGAALTRSMLGDNLARGRASADAQLRSQAFDTGAGLSAQDAGFRQQAAATNAANANAMAMANMQAQNQAGQFNAGAQDNALARLLQSGQGLAGLGAQTTSDNRANIATQGSLAGQLQAIDQAKASAPLTLAQLQSGAFGNLPLNLLTGATTTGTNTTTAKTAGLSPLDWFSNNMALAASALGKGG